MKAITLAIVLTTAAHAQGIHTEVDPIYGPRTTWSPGGTGYNWVEDRVPYSTARQFPRGRATEGRRFMIESGKNSVVITGGDKGTTYCTTTAMGVRCF